MEPEAAAAPFFASYALSAVSRFSDPGRRLYRAFGLERGGVMQVFGPKTLLRGTTALLAGHGAGWSLTDKFQMPGTFLVHDGAIVRAFRHEQISDRPDYLAMARPIDPDEIAHAPIRAR